MHVHDLNATILHCLGIDHKRLTFKFQGRHYRLTDVHGTWWKRSWRDARWICRVCRRSETHQRGPPELRYESAHWGALRSVG